MGSFTDTIEVDPGPGIVKLMPNTAQNLYFIKFTTDGNFEWARQIDYSLFFTYNFKLACDFEGNLYSSGVFYNTVDFDPGPGVSNLSTPLFGVFLLKLNHEGALTWVTQNGNGFGSDFYTLFVDSHKNIYSSGNFSGTMDFDPDTTVYNLTANTTSDMFLQRLSQYTPSLSFLTADSCFSYSLNNYSYSNSGTYQQFLTSQSSCDSILTLNLTIHNVNTQVLQTGIILMALDSTLTYQWIDCDDSFAHIPGETNQSFIPTQNGNYALISASSYCSDTSACFAITTVDSPELPNERNVFLFPNPTTGRFSINAETGFDEIKLVVRDLYGRLIDSRMLKRSEFNNLYLDVPVGMYFVSIISEDRIITIKMIKN
jgi:hypothetical protein